VAPPAWLERMSTISSDPQDTSAAARLEVWNWMLRYVTTDRPLGGGFEVYLIDRIIIRIPGQEPVVQVSRAAHNSIFEVLGEQGWPGLAMFSAIILITLRSQFQVLRRTRNQPQMRWSYDLALALQASLLSVLACGMFTNLAFQPLLWYVFALTFSLSEYVRRVEQGTREAFPAKLGAPALA
jgi:O-antigen ligase